MLVMTFLNVHTSLSAMCVHPYGWSEFLAGHALRSQSRYSAFKETAVMGVMCNHEFPICFINLYHGERYLCYALS